jgi:solute carrier family 25 (mitochondrial citrate transporter), member 1
LEIIKSTLRERGIRGLYAGAPALIIGNAAKAGVRFLTYDSLKSLLADQEVRLEWIRRRAKYSPYNE